MTNEKIARINELYKKSKADGSVENLGEKYGSKTTTS